MTKLPQNDFHGSTSKVELSLNSQTIQVRHEQAVDSLLAMPANQGVNLTSFHPGVFISYAGKVF